MATKFYRFGIIIGGSPRTQIRIGGKFWLTKKEAKDELIDFLESGDKRLYRIHNKHDAAIHEFTLFGDLTKILASVLNGKKIEWYKMGRPNYWCRANHEYHRYTIRRIWKWVDGRQYLPSKKRFWLRKSYNGEYSSVRLDSGNPKSDNLDFIYSQPKFPKIKLGYIKQGEE